MYLQYWEWFPKYGGIERLLVISNLVCDWPLLDEPQPLRLHIRLEFIKNNLASGHRSPLCRTISGIHSDL